MQLLLLLSYSKKKKKKISGDCVSVCQYLFKKDEAQNETQSPRVRKPMGCARHTSQTDGHMSPSAARRRRWRYKTAGELRRVLSCSARITRCKKHRWEENNRCNVLLVIQNSCTLGISRHSHSLLVLAPPGATPPGMC